MDLTVIWAGIIGFAVFAYVVMDGFDLGIGILFPRFAVGEERDQAMNSIAPVWDGNETWLVLGGGGLFAAFPLAYAVILPATYPLIIAMLLGLVFRGVAFEFRWRDPRHRAFWDRAFFAGSLVAALAQGMVLGAMLQGIEVADRAYAGSWWDWLTPYTLLTGLGTVAGYALLGSTWLIWKTEGSCQQRARRLALIAAVTTLVLMGAVSLANLALDPDYRTRWLALPDLALAAPVPVLTAILAGVLLGDLARRQREARPFFLSLGLFLAGTLGIGITIWPYAVPDALTIWDTAAPERSQVFMLVGVALTLPLILAYTAWAYWIFRGKVGTHGYH
ncbi:cytochrome d ubiquinol oxidase subunit II [Alteraurantiacibacter buctensis]|uniref:Cytochrome d ubiquinol oxidase subunit II n=1 Tax=Alteraurantiacibacter buctensis TaxID=1503981 RepID=A0A844YWT1_9SPHN|nr:cytochrome d ubiquinol oxidase subunit II [Alteraurantiacibacter buctensis]